MAVNDIDNPKVVNLRDPDSALVVHTSIGPMVVDMREVKRRFPDLNTGDVLSIGGYRNARGELVPDYDAIRIERQAE